MVTHSSSLAWKIPCTEESGRLQSMGLQRIRHNCVTSLSYFVSFLYNPIITFVNLLDDLFIIQECNSGTSRGKCHTGQGLGKGSELPRPLQAPLSQHLHGFMRYLIYFAYLAYHLCVSGFPSSICSSLDVHLERKREICKLCIH